MAGFQVTLYGRIWVTLEAHNPVTNSQFSTLLKCKRNSPIVDMLMKSDYDCDNSLSTTVNAQTGEGKMPDVL